MQNCLKQPFVSNALNILIKGCQLQKGQTLIAVSNYKHYLWSVCEVLALMLHSNVKKCAKFYMYSGFQDTHIHRD